MARRRTLWVNTNTELQLTAGTPAIDDLGAPVRTLTGLTTLAGFTIARAIIRVTWQADVLANDFDPCRCGLIIASETAIAIGATAIPNPNSAGNAWYYYDQRFIPRVGAEIAATPVYGAFGYIHEADIRSQRKIGNEQSVVLAAECGNNDYDLGFISRILYLLP
jgi:hypothetical protein